MSFVSLLALAPFYFVGTFPTGYLLAKARGIDITSQGSGNVGATNVARIVGRKAGAVTLLVDLCKGALATLLARWLSGSLYFESAAAVAVVCGHCFSLPPKLKGGKGVATSLGAFLVLSPWAAAFGVAAFAATFARFRIVSLASIVAALLTPLFAMFIERHNVVVAALASIALLVVWKHRSNLRRLIEGQERRLEVKKS